MTSNNVTNCPASAPFVLANTTNCSSCPLSAPVFDVNQRICVSCPPNYVVDSTTTRQCVLNITCPTGFTYSNITQKCECSDTNPYFNGRSCISCFLPNFWNRTSLSCQSCPAGSIYKFDQEVCVPCPP